MFLILPLILAKILTGFLAVNFFDPEKKFSKLERILSGILLGFIISSFFILLLALLSKSLDIAIILFITAAYIIAIWKRNILFGELLKKKSWIPNLPFLFICFLSFYLVYLYSLLSYNDQGNLAAAIVPGWGDTAFHLSLIERLSVSSPFNLEHPFFSGINLPYPFLIDFISAIFRHLGADQVLAFRLPLYIFGVIAVSLLFLFIRRQVKLSWLSMGAIFLILLGSGLGFIVFFQDIASQGLSISSFTNPLHQYTNLDPKSGTASQDAPSWSQQIVWIVPVVSFLGHQRSFVLGLAVFIFLLFGIYHYGEKENFWRFGIVAGLLPLIHSHTLIALFLLMAVLFWFFLRNYKSWLIFAGIAFLIALPQLIYLLSYGAKTEGFIKPWFAWMSCSHRTSWLCDEPANPLYSLFSFYIKNFGITFVIWIAALIISILKKWRSPALYGSLIIFLAANFFLFQPWEFDNNKLIFYWWILAVIFGIAPVLSIMWRKGLTFKILAIIFVISGTLAGTVDFFAKITHVTVAGYDDSSPAKSAAAEWINENTQKNAVFLTFPNAGNFVSVMTGRPVYMGYEGWLWSQGINYLSRKTKMSNMLQGDISLACKEKIDYIALDQNMLQTFPLNAETVRINAETVFSHQKDSEKITILRLNCK